MSGRDVTIVSTGAANLASVKASFIRCGCRPTVSVNRKEIESARFVVLPGVGSFGVAMRRLQEVDLVDVLRARLQDQRPTLAICLGMQLLAKGSEESPAVKGLGVVDTIARRFQDGVVVPQFGWNRVVADKSAEILKSGYAYFANSYSLQQCDDGWIPAYATHGDRFVAAIERGRILACQFHPELSDEWGEALIRRWVEKGES